MIKKKYIAILYFLLPCSSAIGVENPATSSASILFNFSNKGCLASAEKNIRIPDDINISSSEVLQFAQSNIESICNGFIRYSGLKECTNFDGETTRILSYYRGHSDFEWRTGQTGFSQKSNQPVIDAYKKAMPICEKELTPEILIHGPSDSQIAHLYSKALSREEENRHSLEEKKKAVEQALAEKRDSEEKLAATIKLAQQTERNFDIKGLNLKLSRQQVIALGGPKLWQCSKSKDDPAIEVCTLSLAEKGCIDKSLIDPRTGGTLLDGRGQPVVVHQKCGVITPIIDVGRMPPAVKKMATVGGQSILSVNVGFFNGTLFEYQILIEGISPELKSGLIEKFGEPTVNNDDHMQWFGKDEAFELLPANAEIVLYRPSLNELSKQHRAAKIMAYQNEAQEKAQKKEKAISEQKKKDF
jgi:hypothetical protein